MAQLRVRVSFWKRMANVDTIEVENKWLGSLAVDDRLRFLARLSFMLTIAGRDSYEAGTDELTNPRQLRLVNEIQHRVTACLSQLLNGTCRDGYELSMAQCVLAHPAPELDHILEWSWNEAKQVLVPVT